MITLAELSELHGIDRNTALMRLRRAGIPPARIIERRYYYPRAAAIAAASNTTHTLPPGTITVAELAALAERTKGGIEYRLKKAGIAPCAVLLRIAPGIGKAGGHPLKLYPQREALAAALDKE